MNRNQFLSVLKSDIDGLDKYSKLDNSKVLLEKEPEAFDYFISLYAKAFPKGKLLENYEPKSLILNSDLAFFKMELNLIDNYSYNLAYKDFFHIQEMKYWLSCKQAVEEIELIYGEYETISEILDATGYTLSGLYREMSDIMYNVKKDYREKLRQEEIERKKKEREDTENKVKNAKEETARKLAELKARREGKSVENKIEFPVISKEDVSVELEKEKNVNNLSVKNAVDFTSDALYKVSLERYIDIISKKEDKGLTAFIYIGEKLRNLCQNALDAADIDSTLFLIFNSDDYIGFSATPSEKEERIVKIKEFLNNTKRFVNAVDEFYYRIKKLKSEEDRKNAKIVISQIDTLLFAFTGFIGVYDAIILLREKLSEQKRLSLADEIEFDIILKHYKEILKNFDCFIDACRADRIKK